MILIADSGSTKTDWVLWFPNTKQRKNYQTKGLNPYFTTSKDITKVMKESMQIEDLSLVEKVYFYGSGCSTEDSKAIVYQGIKTACHHAEINIAHDLMASCRSLFGSEKGIACILGTGSNACLFDGEEIIGEAVSFGYIMGDEGSGNHLGRLLLKSIFNRKAPKEIIDAFNDQFPELDLSQLLKQLYNLPNPNRFLASFSLFINEHRDHHFIRAILEISFNLFLEEFVLDLTDEKDIPISFQGSIAWNYRDILESVLDNRNLKIGKVIKQPIDSLLEFHQKNN